MMLKSIASVFVLSVIAAGALAAEEAKLPLSKPDAAWVKSLYENGQRKVYTGKELFTIGMPCGGIGAGQLYVRGDGTLAQWWIANNYKFTGYGDKCYRTYRPESPLEQGVSISISRDAKLPALRRLSDADFDAIEFVGEYPFAEIRYRTREKPAIPVQVDAEVFSPFIPLNARDSAVPVTVLRYTVKNTSDVPLGIGLAAGLQNGVCVDLAGVPNALSRNTVVREDGIAAVQMDVMERKPETQPAVARRIVVFEDFEDANYSRWKIEGSCFGERPATGTLANQQPVGGWRGKGYVNTFRNGDATQGTASSQAFKISEPFIAFLIGGGDHAGRTCVNLLVDGKVARTVTGNAAEALRMKYWDVKDLIGKEAQIQIVDRESGPWGHINIDYIHFTNMRPNVPDSIPPNHPARGDLSIVVIDPKAEAYSYIMSEKQSEFPSKLATAPLGSKLIGGVTSSARLAPGESKTFTFLITWYFPNRPGVGNMYANWFGNSIDVAKYVAKNIDRLYAETRLFRDTYFDTTLPYWLVQRLGMPSSILATETVQWWKNGRFYAWEGVGCCEGTCTHVWNYDHAGARLFPELERSTRIMQDLGVAFDQKTGLVGFRGNRAYAADGQCGTILKLYREHLTSPDNRFLDGVWPGVKQAMEFMIRHDGNEDGIIEDSQHNTYDINFEGANTFVGSLYLAALRACEEMARTKGENELADRYHRIAERGGAFTAEKMWNGEHFVQLIPPGKKDQFQYGTGCLADQVFGQGWAHQTNLGYIYPPEKVKSALESVYKYCFTSDVGPYNKVFPPERWFARGGDAGLFICTWPKGGRFREPVRYRDEVWTGIEYQVAGHMLYEGMVDEALAIIRAVHDRYDGTKHNPWNEVECGDHYARAMASWGCLLGIEGFIYDGPAGKIGFAPKMNRDDFKAFFTAAEGWGSLVQKREAGRQVNRIEVKWGRLRVKSVIVEASGKAPASINAAGKDVAVTAAKQGDLLTLTLAEPVIVGKGQSVEIITGN